MQAERLEGEQECECRVDDGQRRSPQACFPGRGDEQLHPGKRQLTGRCGMDCDGQALVQLREGFRAEGRHLAGLGLFGEAQSHGRGLGPFCGGIQTMTEVG